MSTKAFLALLLDGPMQSWGHASRFERRTTALHPTRSGVLGLIAAALGIDKHGSDERARLASLSSLRLTTIKLDRAEGILINRLEDYHTVTGIRRASGKVDKDATIQTYRHYLLDARFGVLLESPVTLLEEIATALRNPKWGVWLGRKCCLPATPVLATAPGDRASVWRQLLQRAGYSGKEQIEHFDHILEVPPGELGADIIEDTPVGYGQPIGERHVSRWIRRVPRSATHTPG